MRLSVLVLFGIGLTAGALAEDPAGEVTFSEVTAKLAAPAVIRGTFTQTRFLEYGEFVSSGRFILSDRGLYWRQLQPVGAELIADGEHLLQRVGDNPLQPIDAAANPLTLSFSHTFLEIFNGNEDVLRASFDIDFAVTEDGWSANLAPIDELMASAIDAIRLRGRDYIDELTVITRASDRLVIAFSDLQTNPDHLTDDEIELYAR